MKKSLSAIVLAAASACGGSSSSGVCNIDRAPVFRSLPNITVPQGEIATFFDINPFVDDPDGDPFYLEATEYDIRRVVPGVLPSGIIIFQRGTYIGPTPVVLKATDIPCGKSAEEIMAVYVQ